MGWKFSQCKSSRTGTRSRGHLSRLALKPALETASEPNLKPLPGQASLDAPELRAANETDADPPVQTPPKKAPLLRTPAEGAAVKQFDSSSAPESSKLKRRRPIDPSLLSPDAEASPSYESET